MFAIGRRQTRATHMWINLGRVLYRSMLFRLPIIASRSTLKQILSTPPLYRSFHAMATVAHQLGTPTPASSAGAPVQLKPLEGVEAAKRAAAYASVDNHVTPKDLIIGIGSGEHCTDD